MSIFSKVKLSILKNIPYPNLQQVESGQGSDLMLWSLDMVIKYSDCQARHSAIVKALR